MTYFSGHRVPSNFGRILSVSRFAIRTQPRHGGVNRHDSLQAPQVRLEVSGQHRRGLRGRPGKNLSSRLCRFIPVQVQMKTILKYDESRLLLLHFKDYLD